MIGELASGPIETDVLVIGGGIAGALAALAAKERGLEVTVVRRAWGATALSSGAAHVAPDPLALPSLPLGGGVSVGAAANHLSLARADHPYARLRERLPSLGRALDFAKRETGGFLHFVDVDEPNLLLLSPLGTLQAAAGGLASIAAGDLSSREGRVGIVGFDRLPLFDPELLARAASEAASEAGLGFRAVAVECDHFRHRDAPLLRPHELAARLEAEPERLVSSLRRAFPQGRLELLLFPPWLGRRDPRWLLSFLEERLGIPCAELPAGTQSVPGLRLQLLLEGRLVDAGIRLVGGEVFLDEERRSPSRVGQGLQLSLERSLRLRSAAPTIPEAALFDEGEPPRPGVGVERESWGITAKAVILATGKFIGGGIHRREALRESIFGLPVWVDGAIDEGRWSGDLTTHEYGQTQALFRAGLRTDQRLRPLLRDGSAAAEGLFACGAVLGGNDSALDGAGLGLAAFTAWLAGEAASDQLLGPRSSGEERGRLAEVEPAALRWGGEHMGEGSS